MLSFIFKKEGGSNTKYIHVCLTLKNSGKEYFFVVIYVEGRG